MENIRKMDEGIPLEKGAWKFWGEDAVISCPRCGGVRVVSGSGVGKDGVLMFSCPHWRCHFCDTVRLESWEAR